MKKLHCLRGIAAGLLLASNALAADCVDDSGPRAAVQGYLAAMQDHRFNDAYPYVNENMTDGKQLEEWAALQKVFYEGGAVNILGIDIRKAQAADDDLACALKAIVPNILKSRDKFNNQGTTEFETYTVVKQGDTWKIDSQETLFDAADVQKWFPGEKIPEFRDQY